MLGLPNTADLPVNGGKQSTGLRPSSLQYSGAMQLPGTAMTTGDFPDGWKISKMRGFGVGYYDIDEAVKFGGAAMYWGGQRLQGAGCALAVRWNTWDDQRWAHMDGRPVGRVHSI